MDCGGCHTTGVFLGKPDPQRFLGGSEVGFQIPGLGVFYPPNLTPHPNTGLITSWTQEQFMTRMKGGRVYKGSPMPWESYANMTDADIESIPPAQFGAFCGQ